MIVRQNTIKVTDLSKENMLKFGDGDLSFEDAVYFDLEHYVYKKPKCVGVFGACYFSAEDSEIHVTQYMIENKEEVKDILILAKSYLEDIYTNKLKKSIVTFSGNNDFTVINYLFNKFQVDFSFQEHFTSIDLQKEYEKVNKKSIGLKNLEKQFFIEREECDLISGANLAKTFHKVLKDSDYIFRMPKEKIEKILIYNEADVVNLFHIYKDWKKHITLEQESSEEIKESCTV
ncbi:ribonuclease H-like domain-containing protein [Clostridium paridis]|uniref:Ribonuclease H-like domain-containing protein n=1 Tax=Clostridium paridis TaxID=2803863 RepID=A0A937FDL2_9CLOT|nr:ribonuclease H-like domain-containing protein [Clostridium paridis]